MLGGLLHEYYRGRGLMEQGFGTLQASLSTTTTSARTARWPSVHRSPSNINHHPQLGPSNDEIASAACSTSTTGLPHERNGVLAPYRERAGRLLDFRNHARGVIRARAELADLSAAPIPISTSVVCSWSVQEVGKGRVSFRPFKAG